MTRPPAWQILVAGAGIPSLAFALALRRGAGDAVSLAVIDPRAGRQEADGRAFAVSPAASSMLDALGVWSGGLARTAQPIAAMRITDSRPEDPVRPDYLRFGGGSEGPLGFMLEARHLSGALREACREAGIAIEAGAVDAVEPGPDRSDVVVGGVRRTVSLVVAADGARSRLREAAGIGWAGRSYPQFAIVATVAHAGDHRGIAVQHFLPAGPFAILPLAGPGLGSPAFGIIGHDLPHRSSIVWTEEAGRARALLASPGEAGRALEERFGPELGAIALEGPLSAFPLAVGMARRFVARRLALLGDAAHEIHPLAGQGLNLGLGDAAALAERAVDAIRLGLDPGGDDVLRLYERDRRFEAVAAAGLTDGLNRLFSTDSLPVRAARDLGLGLVDRAPSLKAALAGQAAGATRRAPRLMRGEPI